MIVNHNPKTTPACKNKLHRTPSISETIRNGMRSSHPEDHLKFGLSGEEIIDLSETQESKDELSRNIYIYIHIQSYTYMNTHDHQNQTRKSYKNQTTTSILPFVWLCSNSLHFFPGLLPLDRQKMGWSLRSCLATTGQEAPV